MAPIHKTGSSGSLSSLNSTLNAEPHDAQKLGRHHTETGQSVSGSPKKALGRHQTETDQSVSGSPKKAITKEKSRHFANLERNLMQRGKAIDRTPITHTLARLEQAGLASWTPFAFLRNPIEQNQPTTSSRPSSADATAPVSPLRSQLRATNEELGAPKEILVSTANLAGGSPASPTSPSLNMSRSKRNKHDTSQDWRLDPLKSRTGKEDLALDDPRHIAAPSWARASALNALNVLAPPDDTEIIDAAVARLADSEGLVRVAALRTLQKVAKRGGVRTRAVIDAVTKLIRQGASMDVVAKVRKEACITLAALADLGLPPSRMNKPTGTVRDVAALERDRVVIEALLPLLDDHMAAVRTAAQEALDVVNPGWQRWGRNELRMDDSSLASAETRKPLKVMPPPRDLGSLDEQLWNKRYTMEDLRQDVKKWTHKDDFQGGKVSGVTLEKKSQRYNTLAGYKYVNHYELVRQEAQSRRFEEAQAEASSKSQQTLMHFQDAGSRNITTQWMGIEWVDRSKRTHQGNVLHPLGAGVDLDGRDSVAVPYAPGYNAFATPVGYNFI